ncbi:uncharacterized protein [Haliotis asinina]|uniref:uncharacterized protein n=1 Tax=Haliotis asinina TaxID=109174 RepID=UPI003531EF42
MSRQISIDSDAKSSSDDGETFHLAVIGDSGVGKSTFTSRITKHWTDLSATVSKKGSEPAEDLGINGQGLTVDIIDTSTKKRFSFLQRFCTCDVYVLVYSLVSDASFESAVAAREKILQQKGPTVPIVFVANKTDIADSVDKTERVYRDLNISCEWEHGHVEISAEQDTSIIQVLEQIMKRHHKYVSETKPKTVSRLTSIRKFFSRNTEN